MQAGCCGFVIWAAVICLVSSALGLAGAPVDTVGQLMRGEEFRTYAEFKETVASAYLKDTVRGLLKSFMLYATGRKPDIDDMAEIRRGSGRAGGRPVTGKLFPLHQERR